MEIQAREKFKETFGEDAIGTIEGELRQALGKSLDSWLTKDFFAYHTRLFRLRPIIWLITAKPHGEVAFGCFIYWHKLDADTLHKVREVYLRPALENARHEAKRLGLRLSEQQAEGVPLRVAREAEKVWRQAEDRYAELRELNERIEHLLQPHSLEVQSRSSWVHEKINEIVAQGYRPNRDYGVRVNIEPLIQAGILPASANRIKG